jgi:hypothetical protein
LELAPNITEFFWRDVQEFSFSSELIQPGKRGRFRPLDQAKRIIRVLRALLVFARETGLIEEVSWPTQILECVQIPAPAPRKARHAAA